jgi:hypothetical protein
MPQPHNVNETFGPFPDIRADDTEKSRIQNKRLNQDAAVGRCAISSTARMANGATRRFLRLFANPPSLLRPVEHVKEHSHAGATNRIDDDPIKSQGCLWRGIPDIGSEWSE